MSFPTLVDELCNVSWQGSLRWLTRFVTLLPSSLSTRLLQLFFHVKSAEGFGEGLSSCVQPLLQLTLPANLVRFKLSHYEGITYRILMNDADILVLVCAATVMRYVCSSPVIFSFPRSWWGFGFDWSIDSWGGREGVSSHQEIPTRGTKSKIRGKWNFTTHFPTFGMYCKTYQKSTLQL